MSTVKFKQFTKVNFLKEIGRDLLGQFFNCFDAELAQKGVVLPPATLAEEDYFGAVAKIALSPDGLPDNLVEAAYAIEAMATEEGQDRLERAVGENGPTFQFRDDSSCAEISIQAWLANPEVFAEKFNEQRLARLAAFDYFGSKLGEPQRIEMPERERLALMTTDMEEAFRSRNRGHQTTHIEVHLMEGEHWYLIRHGDTYARVPTVANGRMSVLHFRPAKDDVVVYSPQLDEIRLHAGTKWERDLYRETFGQRLFGDSDYFSERKSYTLDPLRTDGEEALEVGDISGIERIALREFEVAWSGEFGDAMVRKSLDVFASAAAREAEAIPEKGRLVRAVFDVYFTDNPNKARKVQVRPPNILKLGRHCDAALVQRWLTERSFRTGTTERYEQRGGMTHDQRLAMS